MSSYDNSVSKNRSEITVHVAEINIDLESHYLPKYQFGPFKLWPNYDCWTIISSFSQNKSQNTFDFYDFYHFG